MEEQNTKTSKTKSHQDYSSSLQKKFKLFADFTRLDHAIIVVFAIIAALLENFVLQEISFNFEHILFIAAPFFISLYSFAINDIVDYKTDAKNARNDRPLVNGSLSLNTAKIITHALWLVTALLLIACATVAKGKSELISAVVILLGFYISSVLYSIYLKDMPLLGNLFIGFSMAIPFMYAGVLANDFTLSQRLLFGAALLFGTSREVMKSVQDVEGDAVARKSKTLPVIIGIQSSYWFAVWLLLTLLLMALINVLIIVIFFHPVVAQGAWLIVNLGLALLAGYNLKLLLMLKNLEPQTIEVYRTKTKWLFVVAVLLYVGGVIAFEIIDQIK